MLNSPQLLPDPATRLFDGDEPQVICIGTALLALLSVSNKISRFRLVIIATVYIEKAETHIAFSSLHSSSILIIFSREFENVTFQECT